MASLLPNGPRPAVVFTVRVDPAGTARLDGAERAIIESRAKLAYDTVTPADLPAGFADFAARIQGAEAARGAARVDPARVRGTRSQHAERMAAGDAHGLRLRRIPLVVPPYAVPDDAEVGPAPAVRRPVRRDSARVTVAGDRIAIRAAADHGDGAGAVRPAPIAELT